MALEDEILKACREMIRRSKEVTAYTGKVIAFDTTNKIVSVTIDGAQNTTPCIPIDDTNIVLGRRCVILKAGGQYYLIGVLGNRVVNFPDYTGSHPTSNPGDAWFRSDLGHAYINIGGVATQIV